MVGKIHPGKVRSKIRKPAHNRLSHTHEYLLRDGNMISSERPIEFFHQPMKEADYQTKNVHGEKKMRAVIRGAMTNTGVASVTIHTDTYRVLRQLLQ